MTEFIIKQQIFKRNVILDYTDKLMTITDILSNVNQVILKTYRQQLRDFTTNLYCIPKCPCVIKNHKIFKYDDEIQNLLQVVNHDIIFLKLSPNIYTYKILNCLTDNDFNDISIDGMLIEGSIYDFEFILNYNKIQNNTTKSINTKGQLKIIKIENKNIEVEFTNSFEVEIPHFKII